MARYLFHRLLTSLVVLLGLSVFSFLIVRLVPGDAATVMLGAYYTEADAEAMRQRLGLNESYPQWLGRMLRGDLGTTAGGRPVTREIIDALPVTLQLAGMAMTFAVLTGLPLGLLAAARRNRLSDYVISFFSVLGVSVPAFWLGTLLILAFALHLGWLPSGRFVGLGVSPAQNLQHMIMPAVALGAAVAAVVTRMTRAAMLDVIGQDYVRTAVAKGVDPRRVLIRHVARNGLIPVLTILGIQAGYLLGGSIVIEEVFSLNGVGRLVLRAVRSRDYPLIQAAVLLIGAAFIFINLVVDLLYAWVDPRVRAAT